MWCSVVQCGAECGAVWCRVVKSGAGWCNVFTVCNLVFAVCYSVCTCVCSVFAVWWQRGCSVLVVLWQINCSVLQRVIGSLDLPYCKCGVSVVISVCWRMLAERCRALQRVALCCSMLQVLHTRTNTTHTKYSPVPPFRTHTRTHRKNTEPDLHVTCRRSRSRKRSDEGLDKRVGGEGGVKQELQS